MSKWFYIFTALACGWFVLSFWAALLHKDPQMVVGFILTCILVALADKHRKDKS